MSGPSSTSSDVAEPCALWKKTEPAGPQRQLEGSECNSRSYEGNKMRSNPRAPKNIDEYIAGFPNNVQEILEQARMLEKRHPTQKKQLVIKYRPSL
jgi:hypothetical protein